MLKVISYKLTKAGRPGKAYTIATCETTEQARAAMYMDAENLKLQTIRRNGLCKCEIEDTAKGCRLTFQSIFAGTAPQIMEWVIR